jgi:hypothetical protein
VEVAALELREYLEELLKEANDLRSKLVVVRNVWRALTESGLDKCASLDGIYAG